MSAPSPSGGAGQLDGVCDHFDAEWRGGSSRGSKTISLGSAPTTGPTCCANSSPSRWNIGSARGTSRAGKSTAPLPRRRGGG